MIRRLRVWFHRFVGLFGTSRSEREFDDELESHIEMHVEDNIRSGMSPEEARRVALVKLGGLAVTRERYRDARGVPALESLVKDVRYGARALRRSPVFTIVAVVSLALGIGANTALFSVVDTVLLETLPVHEPERLVLFEWEAGKSFRTGASSNYGTPAPAGRQASSSFHHGIFEELRSQESVLTDLFAFAALRGANLAFGDQVEILDGQFVSGGYFTGLGVQPTLGRLITEADDDPAVAPVAVLHHRFWETRFGADPNVVGTEIQINRVPFTVVGVAPPGFDGALPISVRPVVSVPFAFEPAVSGKGSRIGQPGGQDWWWVHVMGRLEPGATLGEARASLDGRFQALALEMMPPPRKPGDPAELDPSEYPHLVAHAGEQGMRESRLYYSTVIYRLLWVVGLVLFVACANVATLMLGRSLARAPEVAVRMALGAGRRRVFRQLLTESLLLAALGGAAGVAFAIWATGALESIGEFSRVLPAGVDYELNWRVLGFTLVVSVITGVVFGLAPAFRATRLDLVTALKERSRSSGGRSNSRLTRLLVVAQIAMSLVLLVGAGLLVQTVRNLHEIELGFDDRNLLVFSLRPGAAGLEEERLERFYGDAFERLEALPGIRAVTFTAVPLIAGSSNNASIILPGASAVTSTTDTNRQIVRENYFEAMDVPLLAGRPFTERDDAQAPRVAIVSESLVRAYFPDQNPIGQRVGLDAGTEGQVEIVGVARDTKYNDLRGEIQPMLYTPWRQERPEIGSMHFAVRAAGDPTSLVPAVREAVRSVSPDVPLVGVTTQEAQANGTIAEERLLANLLSFFGLLALVLAAIGLYGVTAYSVERRTNEIGVRMALGARPGDVVRLVVRQGLRTTVVGLVLGGLAAYWLKRVVESQLYGVESSDPLTFVVVGISLVAVALLACALPARRASKVDPVTALRAE